MQISDSCILSTVNYALCKFFDNIGFGKMLVKIGKVDSNMTLYTNSRGLDTL